MNLFASAAAFVVERRRMQGRIEATQGPLAPARGPIDPDEMSLASQECDERLNARQNELRMC